MKPRLPKRQLIILSLCRFPEPVVLTSALPYLPQMIESFGVPKSDVAGWVGIATAVVAGGQCVMGIPWGLLADQAGRKPVMLFCLACGMVSALLTGFSRSVVGLILSRGCLGLVSGNVGIARAMAAEMVPQKELRAEAFNILYVTLSIAGILGPVLGGTLADLAARYPGRFGKSKILMEYPFALPNLVAAAIFLAGITIGLFFLEETLESKRTSHDYGLALGRICMRWFTGLRRHKAHRGVTKYLIDDDGGNDDMALMIGDEEIDLTPFSESRNPQQGLQGGQAQASTQGAVRQKYQWQRTFSWRSNWILLAHSLVALHSMAFDVLFPVFLHLPGQNIQDSTEGGIPPYQTSGGFDMDTQTIGLVYLITGIGGIFIQFVIFPRATRRHGVVHCLRAVSIISPILYLITPFAVLLPSALHLITASTIMFFKLLCTIFALPCWNTLLNNSASNPKTLGALNGAATSLTGIGRAIGPAIIGTTSLGIQAEHMLLPWWILATFGAVSVIPAFIGVSVDNEVMDTEG